VAQPINVISVLLSFRVIRHMTFTAQLIGSQGLIGYEQLPLR